MEDSIYKICNQLITNTHVIGIIIDCGYFPEAEHSVLNIDKVIELCVISKEIGNQKTMYMDNGYLINIHWYSQDVFTEMVKECPTQLENKKILFDRTGFLKRTITNTTLETT